MNRFLLVFGVLVLATVTIAGTLSLRRVQAQGGGGPSPEAQAARQKQLALEEATPKLQFTETRLPLSIPGHTIGETEGVSKNSKGHLFVYSRTGQAGGHAAARPQAFEFDENNKFVKQWGPDNYAASFAHTVRVDKYDNVWMVDEGSGMIIKFDPNGMVRDDARSASQRRSTTWSASWNAVKRSTEPFIRSGPLRHVQPRNGHERGTRRKTMRT